MKKFILGSMAALGLFLGSPAAHAGTDIELSNQVKGTLAVANGGTGVTTSTGSTSVVLSTSPAITTPTITTPTITGGTINNTAIGATTPNSGVFTNVTLSAGSATVAPLKFTAGTNLTTAAAGAAEYDGTAFYLSQAASTRQVVDASQILVSNTTRTLTAATTAQNIFTTPTNGSLTVPVGTYMFEGFFSLTGLSATSGSFGFAQTGTAVVAMTWTSVANKVATASVAAAPMMTYNTTSTNTALVTANTNTAGYAYLKGLMRVTVAGTIVPQVSLGVAIAAVVGSGAYFRLSPIGSATVTSVGNAN